MKKNTEKSYALGQEYPLTEVSEELSTRERILLEAIRLFALQGYAAVSMKEIAKAVGIKAASLYNHFESKQMLWDSTLDHIEHLYMLYFARLKEATSAQNTFAGVLEMMFVELKSIVHIFTYYSFSLVQAEQFRDAKAGRIFNDVFLGDSISFIKETFDACVAAGWVEAFDTNIVATFFMHTVLIGIEVRVHEDIGRKTPYSVTEMFTELEAFIYRVVGS